jgi:hypothetical protein
MTIYFDQTFDLPLDYPDKPEGWYWNHLPATLLANYPQILNLYNVETSGGRLTVPDIDHADYSGVYFGVMPGWWDNTTYPDTNGEYTPNAPRDVMFAETDILFLESYINAAGYGGEPSASVFGVWPHFADWPHLGLEMYWGYGPNWEWLGTDSWLLDFTFITSAGWAEDNTVCLTTAQLLTGSPITLRLEWQPATYTGTPAAPVYAEDGFIRFLWGGVEVYRHDNIALIPGIWTSAVLPHQIFGISTAYWAAIGSYGRTRLGIISETWVDIANFINVDIDSAKFPGNVGRVLCDLWTDNPIGTIKARLYNLADSVSCGESILITGNTPTQADFPVTISSGVKTCRVQVTGSIGTRLFFRGAGLRP